MMGAAEAANGRKDFFISYTSTDRSWAEWIAWHLEEAGYRVNILPHLAGLRSFGKSALFTFST